MAEWSVKLDAPTEWPFGPKPANTKETAKWPFERPQKKPKE